MPKHETTWPEWKYPHLHRVTVRSSDGRIVKKHGGRVYYFGHISDQDAALDALNSRWPKITGQAAKDRRERPVRESPSMGLKAALDVFMTDKEEAHANGDIGKRALDDYYYACGLIRDALGAAKPIDMIGPVQFGMIAGHVGFLSPVKRKVVLTHMRAAFRFIGKRCNIEFETADALKSPPALACRRQLNRAAEAKLITPDEIWVVLGVACPTMRLLILLAVNGGYRASDAQKLLLSSISDDGLWLTQRRGKNEAFQRVRLWRITRDAIAACPHPDDGRIIRWKSRSQSSHTMLELREKLGLRKDVTLDALRSTFGTVADELGDDRAKDITGGWGITGVSPGYVKRFADHRLVRICAHTRRWLGSG